MIKAILSIFSVLLSLLAMPVYALDDSYFTPQREPLTEAFRWEGASEKNEQDVIALKWYFSTYLERDLDPVKTPWCAGFVDAILYKTGYSRHNTLWARDFLKYGKKVDVPQKGDIVVLTRGKTNGHVGFFVRNITDVNGKKWVGVIGGNTNGEVKLGYYPPHKVLGYRRPVKNFVRVN